MTTTLLSLVVILVAVAAMSVGVIFGRRPLRGSCGGLAALGLQGECEVCGGNPDHCGRIREKKEGAKSHEHRT